MVLCLLNKKYDHLCLLNTRVGRLVLMSTMKLYVFLRGKRGGKEGEERGKGGGREGEGRGKGGGREGEGRGKGRGKEGKGGGKEGERRENIIISTTTPLILVIQDDENDISVGGDMRHHMPLMYYTKYNTIVIKLCLCHSL